MKKLLTAGLMMMSFNSMAAIKVAKMCSIKSNGATSKISTILINTVIDDTSKTGTYRGIYNIKCFKFAGKWGCTGVRIDIGGDDIISMYDFGVLRISVKYANSTLAILETGNEDIIIYNKETNSITGTSNLLNGKLTGKCK